MGAAGADPKGPALAARSLLGRDRELERLFGMIDQIGTAWGRPRRPWRGGNR